MKDSNGARQQSSFKHNNWRQMHYKRIIYNDMVMSYDFTRTRLSQQQEEELATKLTPSYYKIFYKMIKKYPHQNKFVMVKTLPNGKKFLIACFND